MMNIFRLSLVSIILVALPFAGFAAETHADQNLATLATAKGSGKNPMAAIDGVKQQDGKGEWIGESPNQWFGWIKYPSIELKWDKPQKVNKVVLYDRPTEAEHMAACVLKFSDGSEGHRHYKMGMSFEVYCLR
jgi:hypothetical protein